MESSPPPSAQPHEPPARSLSVLLVAAITAAAPLTVAVHGWIAKGKELELAERSKTRDIEMAEREQAFKTQSWFLENAVDPQKTPELRQQVLRFIKGVPGDPNLASWASEELRRVDEIVRLTRELRVKEEDLLSRGLEVDRSRAEALRLSELADKNAAKVKAASAALAEAVLSKKDAERERDGLRRRLLANGSNPNDDDSREVGPRKSIWVDPKTGTRYTIVVPKTEGDYDFVRGDAGKPQVKKQSDKSDPDTEGRWIVK